jgi:hypothetical protein
LRRGRLFADKLTRDSNAVVHLLDEGKFNQAERAADCTSRVIEIMQTRSDRHDSDFQTRFEDMVTEFDRPLRACRYRQLFHHVA